MEAELEELLLGVWQYMSAGEGEGEVPTAVLRDRSLDCPPCLWKVGQSVGHIKCSVEMD